MNANGHGDGWQVLACEHDGGPGARAAIGVIALSNDLVSDGDMRAHIDMQDVVVCVTRIAMSREASVAGLRDMEAGIAVGARLLAPDDRIDVMVYACTCGSVEIGEERIRTILQEVRPGVPTSNPITAAVAALRRLEARRIALLTPYPADINAILERHLTGQGFELAIKGTFAQRGDPEICRIAPATIEKAAIALCAQAKDADALFISCTGLRTSQLIERVEEATGRPVVTSNQALAWHCLTLAGASTSRGRGRLFRVAPPGERDGRR
jgi:maleate isomerase